MTCCTQSWDIHEPRWKHEIRSLRALAAEIHCDCSIPLVLMMASEDQPGPEMIAQEEQCLRKVHPTPEEVPGCMKLFDDFLLCNGELSTSLLGRRGG